jgi:hypothetical protein
MVGCQYMVDLGPNVVKLQPTIPMQILITPLITVGHFWSHQGWVPRLVLGLGVSPGVGFGLGFRVLLFIYGSPGIGYKTKVP